MPFDQTLSLATVLALAHTAPTALVERIDALGIDVWQVPTPAPAGQANPVLVGLPTAPEALITAARFQDSYEAMAIPEGATCCALARPAVLIRGTASSYTLLHEVIHLLLRPADPATAAPDAELRFALAFHRLVVYQRRLHGDPRRLLDAHWRRDILSAQRDVATLLFDRIQMGQSQEAIAERVLATCIDAHSPYFDAERRDEGRRYGEQMIDNAVDVYNELLASITFCADTVAQLNIEAVASGAADGPEGTLSDEEARAFIGAADELRALLLPARAALEELKRFYVGGPVGAGTDGGTMDALQSPAKSP